MNTKEQNAIRTVGTIKNLDLLKVTTIKKKFVDQMPALLQKDVPDGIFVVGYAAPFVIVQLQDEHGNLAKVHSTNWSSYLLDFKPGQSADELDEQLKKAVEKIDNYKQLFQD